MPHVGGDNMESESGRIVGVKTAGELTLISGKYAFRAGEILYSKIRPALNKVTIPDFDGVCSADIYPLRVNTSVADSRYLVYVLRSREFLAYTEQHSSRTNIPKVNRDSLLSYKVALPPLAEQRRIADVLDRAEALRAKRRAALGQLDTLTQAIFLDMFGDPVHNSKKWAIAKVSELCELVRGSSPRPQGDLRFFGGPVPRLMVADITRDGWLVTPRIDSLTIEGAKLSRPIASGTVVMAVSGNVGLVSRLAIDACIHDGFVAFMGLDRSRYDPAYFLALLHFSKALHEKGKAGAIFTNLTTADIKAMQLPLPPITLQE